MGRVGHQEEEPGWAAWGGLKGLEAVKSVGL